MKILITGVAGFLGSHLSEKLAELGHEVVGVDNMTGGYKDNIPKNINFFNLDCCNLQKMNEVMKNVDIPHISCIKKYEVICFKSICPTSL